MPWRPSMTTSSGLRCTAQQPVAFHLSCSAPLALTPSCCACLSYLRIPKSTVGTTMVTVRMVTPMRSTTPRPHMARTSTRETPTRVMAHTPRTHTGSMEGTAHTAREQTHHTARRVSTMISCAESANCASLAGAAAQATQHCVCRCSCGSKHSGGMLVQALEV